MTLTRPLIGIGPGAGHCQAFHAQHGLTNALLMQARGKHFVILQAVELARAEGARAAARAHHHLHDVICQAMHGVDARVQIRPGTALSGRHQ